MKLRISKNVCSRLTVFADLSASSSRYSSASPLDSSSALSPASSRCLDSSALPSASLSDSSRCSSLSSSASSRCLSASDSSTLPLVSSSASSSRCLSLSALDSSVDSSVLSPDLSVSSSLSSAWSSTKSRSLPTRAVAFFGRRRGASSFSISFSYRRKVGDRSTFLFINRGKEIVQSKSGGRNSRFHCNITTERGSENMLLMLCTPICFRGKAGGGGR